MSFHFPPSVCSVFKNDSPINILSLVYFLLFSLPSFCSFVFLAWFSRVVDNVDNNNCIIYNASMPYFTIFLFWTLITDSNLGSIIK